MDYPGLGLVVRCHPKADLLITVVVPPKKCHKIADGTVLPLGVKAAVAAYVARINFYSIQTLLRMLRDSDSVILELGIFVAIQLRFSINVAGLHVKVPPSTQPALPVPIGKRIVTMMIMAVCARLHTYPRFPEIPQDHPSTSAFNALSVVLPGKATGT